MTTIAHPRTSIEAPADLPLVRIEREFNAPVDRVYRAHVEPDLLIRWLGPRGMEMTVQAYDVRRGGAYAYTHRDGEEDYRFFGSFHDVRPNERIVQTFAYEGFADSVSLETLEFIDLGDGRCRLIATSLVDSIEGRDAFVASGMETGVVEGYEKLDELLADQDAG